MNWRATFITMLILFSIWELLSLIIQSTILPGPLPVLFSMIAELPGSLCRHILVSGWRVGASVMLSLMLALPLGLVLGQSRNLSKRVRPFFFLTYPIPKIVLLPVIILFLGIGDISKIFLITLILFYQVLVVVWDAANNIRPEIIHSVRSLGANQWQLLRYVYVPTCLPSTITALRLSISTAIAVLFFTESFATQSGLGFYIMDSWQALQYREMYAAVMAMAMLGFTCYWILEQVEKRICRWTRAGG